MATIKFAQSAGDVTEGKEYHVHKSYTEDEIIYHYFYDDIGDEAVVRKVVGTDTDGFFEIRG